MRSKHDRQMRKQATLMIVTPNKACEVKGKKRVAEKKTNVMISPAKLNTAYSNIKHRCSLAVMFL